MQTSVRETDEQTLLDWWCLCAQRTSTKTPHAILPPRFLIFHFNAKFQYLILVLDPIKSYFVRFCWFLNTVLAFWLIEMSNKNLAVFEEIVVVRRVGYLFTDEVLPRWYLLGIFISLCGKKQASGSRCKILSPFRRIWWISHFSLILHCILVKMWQKMQNLFVSILWYEILLNELLNELMDVQFDAYLSLNGEINKGYDVLCYSSILQCARSVRLDVTPTIAGAGILCGGRSWDRGEPCAQACKWSNNLFVWALSVSNNWPN